MKTTTNYWFTIEPYVFIGITNTCVLLYNTLDGVIIESDKEEVVDLLRETLEVNNCGVILLSHERYQQKNINSFIQELREKYMGDIIDIALSKGKPVQLLPYYNFRDKVEIYKRHNFSPRANILENLYEISIHINSLTNISKLVSFLQSIPGNPTFNIVGNIEEISKGNEILSFFQQHPSPKNIVCSYKDISELPFIGENNFSFKISVDFPIDRQQWIHVRKILLNHTSPIEYIFDISSNDDCFQAEQIINEFEIEKYQLNPIYTGDNLSFFEENVFLTKEDILSTPMTIKDFFSRQAINIYDYGKITIMANGDVYANLNHPLLGNIFTHSVYEIVQKEIEEGKSWFRIRNQSPCNNCVYQWLCPPPSNYEIFIGRSNLCWVSKEVTK